MTAIVTSDVLRLVARLVLGYLDEQHLQEAHNIFCETSRHLTKEYLAYQEGTKSVDTSIGLVNIIAEYFLLKEKLNEFIRTCPKTSFIIELIDTASFQMRFELIFKILKENLLKFDVEVPTTSKRKRRTETEFNISQTNTSTPETHEPLSKRRRISLPNPFVSLSACNAEKKVTNVNDNSAVLKRKELNYVSSSETSDKEDDVSEEEEGKKEVIPIIEVPQKIAPPPPELLSETLLGKPNFAETLADLINKTRSAKELESPEASTSQNILTQNDVQDILSKTEHENDFEDILKEVIDKYLEPSDDVRSNENDVQSTSSSPSKDEAKTIIEIPIKQRLRPRSAKKILPPSEKKKKLPKVNIISDEIYTGPLPICVNIPQVSEPIPTQSITEPLIVSLVPIMPQTFIPLETSLAQIPTTSSLEIVENNSENIVLETQEVQVTVTEVDKENKPSEKSQQTPKLPINASFLESKCKSTPRRKATHVRILDFNQTPSATRLSAIKEFSTPISGIKMETPGSAPASISVQTQKNSKISEKPIVEETIEIVDESSNSTSISNTPKVAKNRRRRKIEIDTKKVDESPAKEPPMTREEWDKMRAQQKSLSVDERMRLLFQESEVKVNHDSKKRRKTPKKKKLLGSAKKASNGDVKEKPKETQNQPAKKINRINGGGAKFKVTSPRKAALLRKTPKKKKLSKSPILSVKSILTPNIDIIKQKKEEKPPTPPPIIPEPPAEKVQEEPEKSESSDLNRSDTVQEVATLLTHLPETILAKTSSGSNLIEKNKIDPQVLMETPLKLDANVSPLPNTPRFAIPLITSSTQETPVPKAVSSTTTVAPSAIPSLMKVCDILTPSFPITPGFKETPIKSDHSPTSASGYSSRRTDYSSCSSYYKPDESEEINQNFETMIKQARERNSQSESDGGVFTTSVEIEKSIKIRVGSAKKVECPGAIERVLSFTEEKKEIPTPHYTMMDEGLLSESIVTTASDSDSSSSFTCSTCSTDPSTDDVDILNQSDLPEDADNEWKCEHVEVNESNNSLVDEKTGEVRFPLRNLMTPRKMELEIKEIISSEAKVVKDPPPPPKNTISDLEAIKQRTLRILKNESAAATTSKKNPVKIKKSNAKVFKLPPQQPKAVPQTRREQILNQNLTERSRPTPLKLIPSSSSSRRKNATPRKTIIIDELPKAPSPIKKQKVKKKSEDSQSKSPSKPERVSLENINDNAVMHDEHPSLNISSSFNNESSDEEIESTTKTVIKNPTETKKDEEGSNTFQQAMISQGFDKKEVIELEAKLNEKEGNKIEAKASLEDGEISSSSDETEDEEEECTEFLSHKTDKLIFNMEESKGEKIKKSFQPLTKFPPSKVQIEGKNVKIDFSSTMDIFSFEPEQQMDLDKKKGNVKDAESNDHNVIDKILSMLHPSK